ncbi:hypothetical protein A3A75_00775 [Candidatus Woesebacteria bacterium RIFCSPLOWO2_01_FULL_39_10]|uniref:Nucleotidyl transferase AbiEii/AbiGii toxin family protein n=1 Tax=Candidatus Woesebacteria bacterium RIFCSPLOWO2_01_FULL_39_10 TaxID=1802516 RepID=A0A1F8B3C0_9BACT|nr:MAG: hypothetical protein A3A75_00775 [Candidatus Woesebacteria bacterium RIFCSPLOWO2_01_FULL_39_10]
MISIKKEDILHKFQLLKLLTAIVDDPQISQRLYFKGGTCAAMAGFLDRFSIDLDFDLRKSVNKSKLKTGLEKIFKDQSFTIANKKDQTLFYLLKYKAPPNRRNTLRLSVFEDIIKANDYKPIFLPEIGRLVNCQTIETMFANKLVAPIDRYQKHEKIAGRDIYDIHYFFSQGYKFKDEIIKERTGVGAKDYIKILIEFIEDKITQKILTEDLSTLLPYPKFQKIRKTLKDEVLIFLKSSRM